MIDVTEVDALTGSVTTRDFTDDERATREAEMAQAEQQQAARDAAAEAAEAKLAALGLTVGDLKALGL